MAAVLCPVNPPSSFANGVHSKGTSQYLCASVVPGQIAEAYELDLWRQLAINVDWMDKEIILEYDAGTRYYYISV